ncbi:hypothetical protein D3C76_186340 [compost metagenome]
MQVVQRCALEACQIGDTLAGHTTICVLTTPNGQISWNIYNNVHPNHAKWANILETFTTMCTRTTPNRQQSCLLYNSSDLEGPGFLFNGLGEFVLPVGQCTGAAAGDAGSAASCSIRPCFSQARLFQRKYIMTARSHSSKAVASQTPASPR